MESAARDMPGLGGSNGQEYPEVDGNQEHSQLDNEGENVPRAKKPGFLKRFLVKADINVPTLMMMFK
jgi:hypothetical protein